jgi:hypothetical protein
MKTTLYHRGRELPGNSRHQVARAVELRLGPLREQLARLAVFLRPIVDPEIGPGWRCELHAFPHTGPRRVTVATGFEPPGTAQLAARRMAEVLEEQPAASRMKPADAPASAG